MSACHLSYGWMVSVLVCLLSPLVSQAATYYAAPGGSSTAACAQAQPCSLNRGVSLLGAGDTLYLRGGTYSGAIGQHGTGTVASGTSWSNAVTIASAPGETAILAGRGIHLFAESYLIFDRLTLTGGQLLVSGQAHHIRFQDGEIQDGPSSLVMGDGQHLEVLRTKLHGASVEYVAVWGASIANYGVYWSGRDSLFEGNEVYGNPGYGLHIYGSGSDRVSGNVVRGNRITSNGLSDPRGYYGCGVILATGSGNQALHNTIEGNGCGVQVDYRCMGCTVGFNTITNSRGSALTIGASAVGTRVCGNTLTGNRPNQIEDSGQQTQLTGCTDVGPPVSLPPRPPPRPRLPAPWNVRLAPAG